MKYIHTMEYYPRILFVKPSGVLIYATTWINLKNILLSGKARHKRPHIA
jgi:hypothetical protein